MTVVTGTGQQLHSDGLASQYVLVEKPVDLFADF